MKNTRNSLYFLAVVAVPLFATQQVGAFILYDYVRGLPEGESYYLGYAQPIVGYDFVPNTSITIGALGAYDHHYDGLDRPNQVGLWERSTGTLLASATVPGGSVGQLHDGYRWTTIAPISTYCWCDLYSRFLEQRMGANWRFYRIQPYSRL